MHRYEEECSFAHTNHTKLYEDLFSRMAPRVRSILFSAELLISCDDLLDREEEEALENKCGSQQTMAAFILISLTEDELCEERNSYVDLIPPTSPTA